MPTDHAELFAALAAPFTEKDPGGKPVVRTRKGTGGKDFSYVTARVVMNRLDDVLGPEHWWDVYSPHENSVECQLTLRLPDGTTVTKSDAGAYAGMSDQGDDDKSGYSDAFKRAAVKFGVGRYLYQEGMPEFVRAIVKGPKDRSRAVDPNPQVPPQVYRAEPEGPPPPNDPAMANRTSDVAWVISECQRQGHYERLKSLAAANHQCAPDALSGPDALALYRLIVGSTATTPRPTPPPREAPPLPGAPGRNPNGNPETFGWPTSGAALYRWCKNIEESLKLSGADSLVKAIDFYFRDANWPRTWKEWDREQVQEAAMYAAGLVRQCNGYAGQFEDRFPTPQSPEQLRDRVWELAIEQCRAMGNNEPSTELISRTVMDACHSLGQKHSGELIADLRTCENEALMKDVIDLLESDLKDARAAF